MMGCRNLKQSDYNTSILQICTEIDYTYDKWTNLPSPLSEMVQPRNHISSSLHSSCQTNTDPYQELITHIITKLIGLWRMIRKTLRPLKRRRCVPSKHSNLLLSLTTQKTWILHCRGPQIVQKPKTILKILGARRVTWRKFHTNNPLSY